jgi:hypothetical protein
VHLNAKYLGDGTLEDAVSRPASVFVVANSLLNPADTS